MIRKTKKGDMVYFLVKARNWGKTTRLEKKH